MEYRHLNLTPVNKNVDPYTYNVLHFYKYCFSIYRIFLYIYFSYVCILQRVYVYDLSHFLGSGLEGLLNLDITIFKL